MSLAAKLLGTPNDDLVSWRDAKKDPPPMRIEVLCQGLVRLGEYGRENIDGYFVASRDKYLHDEHVYKARFGFSLNGVIDEVYQWRPINPLPET